MIVDDIKSIIDTNGWEFLYGDKATQNLMNGEISSTPNFFLLPVEKAGQLNDYNKPTFDTWTISFLLCKKSDLDGGTSAEEGKDYYYEKWLNNIKPFYRQLVDEFISSFVCLEQYTITTTKTVEIINSMDWNVDGLFVTLTVKEDLIW